MRRRTSALAVLTLLLSATSASAVADPPARATALVVTGYVLDGSPTSLVDHEAPALGELGVDGVTLTRGGRSVGRPSAGAVRLVRRAHADGLRAELLVSNYSDALGDFSPKAAARLLRSRANVDRVATRLASYATRQGCDGITVDLESLSRADGAGLVRLVSALQHRMPRGKRVSVDLMAATTTRAYAARGYRLRALAAHADVLALMTYDEHGPGWSGPGPIGSLGWQRRAVAALGRAVPARKIDLGVAGYGYSWPTRGTGRDHTVAEMRALVSADGATATFDRTAGEWTATLRDGTVLWWSDRASYDLRRALAAELGLHGLALWRLGSADSLV